VEGRTKASTHAHRHATPQTRVSKAARARARTAQLRLVDDVGQVGAHEAGQVARQLEQVDVGRELWVMVL
jgi:hypothetical protein